ncbi:Fanconi anemia group F protein [Hyperolius riggenbachi]|uniref:Fanconi anemia group F protein n=1 Tax=Hyperolius riggenbachi TaxID=752182 RepID=UPI0035A3B18C
MAEKLKLLLENLDHFVEVLALSHTTCVKDWDLLNVKRALEWGSYFQQVHHRFKANSSIRKAIEDHLTVKNEELRVHVLNYQDVTFADLMKGKAIFCMALYHNSAIPPLVFKYLVELLHDSDSESVKSPCLDHIITQKAASELFLSLSLFSCDSSRYSLDNPVLVTQGDMLRSSLENRLKMSEGGQNLSAVSDVLGGIPRPLVYHLIAVVLLSLDTWNAHHQDHLAELLIDWLMSNNPTLADFCLTVNLQALARLSSKLSRFRNTYLDYLVTLGAEMEQEVTSGKWTCRTRKLTFHEFLEYFRCLLKGPDELKEITLTRLRALKTQDGDYEVSGISIWTDVLTELNKS